MLTLHALQIYMLLLLLLWLSISKSILHVFDILYIMIISQIDESTLLPRALQLRQQ